MRTALTVIHFFIIIGYLVNFLGEIKMIMSQEKEKVRKALAIEISIAFTGIIVNVITLLCGFYKVMAVMLIILWLVVIITNRIIKIIIK